MRSIKGEVVLKVPAGRAWEMYRDDDLISKIDPEMLTHAEYIKGDGSPGSLRLFKLGPAVSDYVKESTQKIEAVEIERSVTYSVVAGELSNMYDPYKVTFSFHPVEGKERECVAEWKVEYEPLTPAVPPPEKAKEVALAFLKSFEMFEQSS